MTNDEITKKDYLLDGQALDPNPTRARTFILGEGYIPTEREPSVVTEEQRQRMFQAQVNALKAQYPQLTEEDILDFL